MHFEQEVCKQRMTTPSLLATLLERVRLLPLQHSDAGTRREVQNILHAAVQLEVNEASLVFTCVGHFLAQQPESNIATASGLWAARGSPLAVINLNALQNTSKRRRSS